MVSKSNNNRWHSLQVEAHSITRPSDGNSDPIGVGLSKKKKNRKTNISASKLNLYLFSLILSKQHRSSHFFSHKDMNDSELYLKGVTSFAVEVWSSFQASVYCRPHETLPHPSNYPLIYVIEDGISYPTSLWELSPTMCHIRYIFERCSSIHKCHR